MSPQTFVVVVVVAASADAAAAVVVCVFSWGEGGVWEGGGGCPQRVRLITQLCLCSPRGLIYMLWVRYDI